MTDWGYTAERRAACVAAFGDWHTEDLWKHPDDLRRYEQILEETRPDVIIETGTNTGASATWFVSPRYHHGRDIQPYVMTIDMDLGRWNRAVQSESVYRIDADSTAPYLADKIRKEIRRMVDLFQRQPRVMVSLDSDHSESHVRKEIELYAPLVTSGCYLVIEDGIFSWLRDDQWREHGCMRVDGTKIYDGTPLDAIEEWDWFDLDFIRDTDLEFAYPVTMSPAGWWRRG